MRPEISLLIATNKFAIIIVLKTYGSLLQSKLTSKPIGSVFIEFVHYRTLWTVICLMLMRKGVSDNLLPSFKHPSHPENLPYHLHHPQVDTSGWLHNQIGQFKMDSL